MATFPDRLKELRKSKKITQKVMAEYLGMVEQAYQKYEYGKIEPNIKTIAKLADFFDVSIDYLVGRTNDPKYSVLKEGVAKFIALDIPEPISIDVVKKYAEDSQNSAPEKE